MILLSKNVANRVAPHWGAWIEINAMWQREYAAQSHPTGVRGLKLQCREQSLKSIKSHPTGVRGLKSKRMTPTGLSATSHPTGVRGLKSLGHALLHRTGKSHPTGVRGLKFRQHGEHRLRKTRRTPLGCVD